MLNGSMIPRGVRRLFDERSEPREPAGSQAASLEDVPEGERGRLK